MKSNKEKKKDINLISDIKIRLIAALIVLFTFMLYGNTLKHDYSIDDDIVSKKNSLVQQGVGGLGAIFSHGYLFGFNGLNEQYRPLTLATFAIEKQVAGNSPTTSHWVNLLIYALTCVALFYFLLLITGKRLLVFPLLVTLIFAAHPIHTEAVSNIKSRDELLALFFGLIAFIHLHQYIQDSKDRKKLYFSLLAYFAALLSKETAVTYLAIVPLILWVFTELPLKRILIISFTFASIMLLYFSIRTMVLQIGVGGEGGKMDIINNSLMGAENIGQYYASAFVILLKYFKLMIIPYPLSWDYSYNQIPLVELLSIQALSAFLVYGALLFYAIRGIIKKDILAFGILFFLITLSVTSNLFIKIGATMGERFFYSPSLGFVIIMAIVLMRLFKLPSDDKQIFRKNIFIYSMAIILAVFSFLTIVRNKDWKNQITLFEAGVKACPNSARCHFSLACEYRDIGDAELNPSAKAKLYKQAIASFNKSIDIYPKYGASFYNMGVIYQGVQDYKTAQHMYKKAIDIDSLETNTLNNLGTLFYFKQQYDSALVCFSTIIRHAPNDPNGLSNIGAIYYLKGDKEKAFDFANRSYKQNKTNKNTLNILLRLYSDFGDTPNAERIRNELSSIN